jgi:putative flavoprotein involved in K+ transport
MAFPAPADTYPTKDPVADYLQAYAAAFDLPIRLNARVTDLRRVGDDFQVRTADATYRARQVVVATGPFQVAFVPPPAATLDPSVTQVHSADYRNPQALPEGPVLVVGAATLGSRSPRSWPPPAPSTCRSPPPIRCCPSGVSVETCSGG